MREVWWVVRSDYLNRGDGSTDMFTLKKFIKLMTHDSCIFLYLCYTSMKSSVKKEKKRDFPGGPVVKIPCFHCRGHRFNPLMGNEDPTYHIVQPPKEKLTSLLWGEEGITTLMPSRVYFVLDMFCVSQGHPEKQNQWEIHFYYKEWAHTTVEADKF